MVTKHKAATPGPEYIEPDLWPLLRRVGPLKLNPKNARVHDEVSLDAIQQSLADFRQQKPIVLAVDAKTVVAGEGTLRAAQELGWEWIAAVVTTLTAEEAAEYALADNRTGDLSYFSRDVLVETLENRADPTKPMPGWDRNELQALLVKRAAPPSAEERKAIPAPPGGAKQASVPAGITRMVVEFETKNEKARNALVDLCTTNGLTFSEYTGDG